MGAGPIDVILFSADAAPHADEDRRDLLGLLVPASGRFNPFHLMPKMIVVVRGKEFFGVRRIDAALLRPPHCFARREQPDQKGDR